MKHLIALALGACLAGSAFADLTVGKAARIGSQVGNATVGIQARRSGGPPSAGYGFVVDGSGTVATSLHLVEDSDVIEVLLPSHDVYPVVGVIAIDRRRDIALLKIGAIKLPTVAWGDSDAVKAGQPVLVAGNAKGTLESSVTAATVGGIRDADGYRLIELNVGLSPLNTGAPVVDENGQAIGLAIATAKIEPGDNTSFAVPIYYVKGLVGMPVTSGLAMLKRAPDPAPAVQARAGNPLAKNGEWPYPMLWKSVNTGNVKMITVTPDGIRVENQLHPALAANGAESRIEFRQEGDQWTGIHYEKVNCRPNAFANRHVCPTIRIPARITSITPERIEGFGEEPLNDAPFDCSRCEFSWNPKNRPFVWVPVK